jgi:hypothetical protein
MTDELSRLRQVIRILRNEIYKYRFGNPNQPLSESHLKSYDDETEKMCFAPVEHFWIGLAEESFKPRSYCKTHALELIAKTHIVSKVYGIVPPETTAVQDWWRRAPCCQCG